MSFACFFTYLFGHSDAVTPTVITYPGYTFLAYFGSVNAPNTALAETFEGFAEQWIIYWKTLISKASKINNIWKLLCHVGVSSRFENIVKSKLHLNMKKGSVSLPFSRAFSALLCDMYYLQQQSFLLQQQDMRSHKNTRSQQSIFLSQPQHEPHPHPPHEPPQQHRSNSMTNMSLQPHPWLNISVSLPFVYLNILPSYVQLRLTAAYGDVFPDAMAGLFLSLSIFYLLSEDILLHTTPHSP